jgi:hypothetical protein
MAMRMNTGQGNEEHHEEPTQYPAARELTAGDAIVGSKHQHLVGSVSLGRGRESTVRC